MPAEVTGLEWNPLSKDDLQWDMTTAASFYQLYRGLPADLRHLLDGSIDSCTRMTVVDTSTGNTLNSHDDEVAAGGFHWFLVRAGNGSGLGPAGNATAGPRIQDSSGACP